MKTPKTKIPEGLLAQLRNDLAFRRIGSGIECLRRHLSLLSSLDDSQKCAATLLGLLAEWVDIGFDQPHLVRESLARFPQASRASLPLIDYLHLRMAEGFVAMSDENYQSAIHHLETLLSMENEIQDRGLTAIANFWIGRCHRKMGRYDDAVKYTIRGKERALQLQYPKMAAIMQVQEGWLMFQGGRLQEAGRILKEAEGQLAETDDYITLGNIHSAYGRIARRQGRYDQALRHFAHSMEEYKKRHPQHRNLARVLTNIAFVKRLIALRLEKKMDREAPREGKKPRRITAPAAKIQERTHLEELRRDALAYLAQAEENYTRYNDHRGLGTVHIDRGLLYLDSGDLDAAANEGAAAYQLGEEKNDYLLEARARILQSTVENAKFEEQIDEKSGHSHRAQAALDFAREAVDFAKHTQNRRLLARACLAQGTVLANDFFGDSQASSECCDSAAALLKHEGQDYVWEELQTLRSKLFRASHIDATLRQWSQGIVGDKTFQEIAEEFAGIVIPKVWDREGRKVSRVAARMSISPKKVRRILAKKGLLDGKDEA